MKVGSWSKNIIPKINSLEVAFLTVILERFNPISTQVQFEEMVISIIVNLYTSLLRFVEEMKISYELYKNFAENKLN